MAGLLLSASAAPAARAKNLDPDDRALLEAVLRTTVFDPPPSAERVRLKVRARTIWAQAEKTERDAWLVPAEAD